MTERIMIIIIVNKTNLIVKPEKMSYELIMQFRKCNIPRNHLPQINIKDKKTYIRISSTKWKLRYNNHGYSFSHEHLKNQTALSKQFWSLKNKGLTPEIQWSILKKSNTPKCFDSRCNLYLEEKYKLCYTQTLKNY